MNTLFCKLLIDPCLFQIRIIFFVLFAPLLYAQNPSFQDNLIISRVEEKAIAYYQTKKTLSYSFVQTFYTSQNSKELVSKGNVRVIKMQDSLYYRGIHLYDAFPDLKFEIVKNKDYFGVNNYQSNYFSNYYLLPVNKRFYTFNNSPDNIMRPDTFLKTVFRKPSYSSSIMIGSDHYRLQLSDTNKYSGNLDNQTFKQIKVYYISKKDYRITKYSSHKFWTSGDLIKNDSVVYYYTYEDIPHEEVKTYVDSFKPLTGKKQMAPPPPKDSLKIFPAFHLPDSSGKIKEIDSKYVLVDFWYKACAPCLANMNFLDKIAYKDLEVVTINIKDSIDNDIRKIISKHSFTFLFNGQELNKELKLNAYPTMYLFDKNRNILYKHIGYGDTEKLVELLNALSSK